MTMSNSHSTTKTTYKHLSEAERGQMQAYLSEGKTSAEIARLLGRHRSTISREIKRGSVTQKQDKNGKEIYYQAYLAETAQLLYRKRREKSVFLLLPRVPHVFLEALSQAIKAKPRCHSLDSFVHWYRAQHPQMTIPSTKTLYTYIHQGLLDLKPIDLPRAVRLKPRPKSRPSTRRVLGTSIDERPDVVNSRAAFGHWEIDTVLGVKRAGEPAILTLVERQTRYALTVYLAGKQANLVNQAVQELCQHYPITSITADNGAEFASLNQLEGIEVYYANPYSSWQRGSNENFNGLLREAIPKGQSLKLITPKELEQATLAINLKPRKIHNYQSAQDVFEQVKTA